MDFHCDPGQKQVKVAALISQNRWSCTRLDVPGTGQDSAERRLLFVPEASAVFEDCQADVGGTVTVSLMEVLRVHCGASRQGCP